MKSIQCSSVLLAGLSCLFVFSGCNLFGPEKRSETASLLPRDTGSTFTVMLKGSKPETMEITEGMTVQGVIDSTNARKKIGGMDIVIKRMVPGKQIRHNLKVDYDNKKKRVPFDQDYTIYPNDIVMISPGNNTQLDKMVDTLSGVFGSRID